MPWFSHSTLCLKQTKQKDDSLSLTDADDQGPDSPVQTQTVPFVPSTKLRSIPPPHSPPPLVIPLQYASSFSTTVPEKQPPASIHYPYLKMDSSSRPSEISGGGRQLPDFGAPDPTKLPSNVRFEQVQTFMLMYRTHCQLLLDTTARPKYPSAFFFSLALSLAHLSVERDM